MAALTNQNIMVKSSQLPILPDGEYYWHQLLNLKVINQDQKHLGVVTEIIPTGSNDVLVVRGDKQYLIPYLPEHFIMKIDLANNEIHVEWDLDIE